MTTTNFYLLEGYGRMKMDVNLMTSITDLHIVLSCVVFLGLVDPGENVVEAALRELKEETGLTGTIGDIKYSGDRVVALDPGISGSTISIVTVQVGCYY